MLVVEGVCACVNHDRQRRRLFNLRISVSPLSLSLYLYLCVTQGFEHVQYTAD